MKERKDQQKKGGRKVRTQRRKGRKKGWIGGNNKKKERRKERTQRERERKKGWRE